MTKKLSEKQRKEMIEDLEVLDEIEYRKKENPLKYSQRHFKQSAFYKAMQYIRALFWGNRVGKTEIGAMEVARYMLGEHEHRDVEPPIEVWVVCPSFDVQRDTTQPKLLSYLPESEIASTSSIRKGIYSEIILKNGSRVNFKSYEQGREKFQGAAKRLIWFDEEPPHDIYEECLVRQEAGVPLDIILTMTPVKGMTWVYDDIYLSTDTGLYYVSTAGWDDNPFLTEEQKDIMARGLTKEALLVRREGKFTKRVGLVCNWWDRNLHIRDYKELPSSWTYYEVLDGGYSDPAAWLLVGVDHDDSIHVVDGFRESYMRTEDIKRVRDTKIGGVTIRRGWSDADNPRLNTELRTLGMKLTSVTKKVAGVASWDEALAEKMAEYGTVQKGTGEPRLFISSSLMRVDEKTGKEQNWMMQEMENLLWVEKLAQGVSEQKPMWDDHRRYGHHFDGLRALAYFLISYKAGEKDRDTRAVVTPIRDDPYHKPAASPHTAPVDEGGIL